MRKIMNKYGIPLLNKDIPMPKCKPPKVERNNNMYFVTVIEDLDDVTSPKRCCGYYSKFNEAVDTLKDNECDIYEMCYEYAVIEEISEGIYPNCLNRGFFKWDNNKNGYVAIEEPECVKNISNFSVG